MVTLIMKDIISALWLVLLPLLLLIIILAGQWVRFKTKNRELLKFAAKLPSPTPTKIILGNWYKTNTRIATPIFTGEDLTRVTLANMRAAAEQPYSLYSLWIGPVPYIFVQNPYDVKVILNSSKSLYKGFDARLLSFALGDGLITVTGSKWKISRRYMNPIFHHVNINNLTGVFNQVGHQLVKDLACQAGGEPFDVLKPLFKSAISSVSSLIFGIENQSKMNDDDFKAGASFVSRVAKYSGKRVISPWLWSDKIFYFTYKNELKYMDEKWTQFRSNARKNNEHEEFITVPKVYSNILREHTIFTEANMEDEMKTTLSAGSETTAVGLSSCLMLLGSHSDIQEKLYNEIVGVLNSGNEDVTIQDVNNLQYLDQVIKESLRMSTVISNFQRAISEEMKLSECTIPKGVNVTISVIGLHYDPEVYPDPYVFNPERFTPENVAKRHPYSYLPFSGGPRNCIGKQYAMTSMKIMLIYIMRAYKIFTSENLRDLRYQFTVSLKSIDGYKIRLERRTK